MNGARASQTGVPAFGGDEEPGQASTQTPPGQAAAPSEPAAPAYLTRAEFDQLMAQERAANARLAQSQADKAASAIQRRYQAAQDGYTRAAEIAVKRGYIPADKAEAYAQDLRNAAMQDALTPEPPAQRGQQQRPGGQAPNQAPPDDSDPGDADVERVNARAAQLAQQFGLAGGDPELEHVYTAGTPEEYLASIAFAGRAKQRRLAAAGGAAGQSDQPESEATPAPRRNAAARAPSVSPTGRAAPKNPIAHISDPDALYDLEWQKTKQGGQRNG